MITVNVIRLTCLPEKTTWGSPRCFELEKCQAKTPPVRLTRSLMWSHFTPRRCSTCKIIWSGLKTLSMSNTPRHAPTPLYNVDLTLMKFDSLKQLVCHLMVVLEERRSRCLHKNCTKFEYRPSSPWKSPGWTEVKVISFYYDYHKQWVNWEGTLCFLCVSNLVYDSNPFKIHFYKLFRKSNHFSMTMHFSTITIQWIKHSEITILYSSFHW